MLSEKKIIVILPAYNAEKTLEKTLKMVPEGLVDEFVLVDDNSSDNTYELAKKLGINALKHEKNLGYGGNQKSCYKKAMELGGDIVVMLHPDYQYDPRLVPAMASMIASDLYDVVLGSRILGRGALAGGMPLYKYIANRVLTFIENILLGLKLSEYHTGYRAYSKKALEAMNLEDTSDDFVFDNQVIALLHYKKMRFGEISCPAKYFPEASSINFARSVKYGFGVLITAAQFRLQKWGVAKFKYLC